MAKPEFQIYEKSGWRWKLIAANGESVAISEPYVSKANAKRGAETVKALAPQADITGA